MDSSKWVNLSRNRESFIKLCYVCHSVDALDLQTRLGNAINIVEMLTARIHIFFLFRLWQLVTVSHLTRCALTDVRFFVKILCLKELGHCSRTSNQNGILFAWMVLEGQATSHCRTVHAWPWERNFSSMARAQYAYRRVIFGYLTFCKQQKKPNGKCLLVQILIAFRQKPTSQSDKCTSFREN